MENLGNCGKLQQVVVTLYTGILFTHLTITQPSQVYILFCCTPGVTLALSSLILRSTNEKGTGANMHPAIVSGIITGDMPVP